MQIPIVNGIYASQQADFRTSYPRNLMPIPKDQGISSGYLRPCDGLVQSGTGPGADRGAINWNGVCYRVMGSKLCKIDATGVITQLGDVGNDGLLARLSYSFDRLMIVSSGKLFYFDGAGVTQVTDVNLGVPIDGLWADGYYVTTDGTSLVVTELNDPYAIDPLKYGSAEADPDPVKGIEKYNREIHAVNRYTIETFENIGGEGFPYQRVNGAMIERGAIGTRCKCIFMDAVAFMGGARQESIAIWIGKNGTSAKISTREIDQILKNYTEEQLSKCLLEARSDNQNMFLYIHLPDQTLIYDGAASKVLSEPAWHTVDSGNLDKARYRARSFVWCYDKWLCGDPTENFTYGYLTDTVSDHYGTLIGWEFGTPIVYNIGKGAICHRLELVALNGRIALGKTPTVWTSYSSDGETWSQEKPCKLGKIGDRNKRVVWLQQGSMENMRIQKFRGDSDAFISFARLEAEVEPLYV